MKSTIFFLLTVCVVLSGCQNMSSGRSSSSGSSGAPSSSSGSQDSVLTNDGAQRAIDSWANGVKGDCSSEPCRVEVISVREIPAQNLATASIKFDNFVYKDSRKPGEQFIFRSDKGSAKFEKFTNGRWTLTEIDTEHVRWNTKHEVY